jgi:hypothetical protein
MSALQFSNAAPDILTESVMPMEKVLEGANCLLLFQPGPAELFIRYNGKEVG